MKTVKLPLPELISIVATRAVLGAGVALLFGDRIPPRQRRILGIVFTGIGLLSTAPLLCDLIEHRIE